MNIGDLVLVNGKLVGLILDTYSRGKQNMTCYIQYFEGGETETRWVQETFLEKLLTSNNV